jgi:multidrug efflux pump subunit AcrA (membrane-fusion protein)
MSLSARFQQQSWFQLFLGFVIVAGSIGISLSLVEFFRSEPVTAKEQELVPGVRTALVQPHADGVMIEADGVVVPYREIELAAEVSGRVVEQSEICRAGNYVTAGTLLIKIDARDYELEVERLEKELQQATVSLEELAEEIAGVKDLIELAKKEVALRVREMNRQRNLVGVVTSTDLERAEANELNARNTLMTLGNRQRLLNVSQGRLEGARALTQSKLKKAQLDVERTHITAPVDGVIVKEMIEKDSYVQKGMPLLTIEDTSRAEVKCKLEMEELYWLWDQRPATTSASAEALPSQAYDIPQVEVDVVYRLAGREDMEYVWRGQLSRYDGIGLDANTRTVPCRVVVDRPLERIDTLVGRRSGPPALVRGMFVSIRIQAYPQTPLLRIPEEALQPGEDENNVVWRVRDGRLVIIPVQFVSLINSTDRPEGGTHDALIYVTTPDSLQAQDQVVVSPMASVRSGMEVQMSETAGRVEDS